MRWLPINQCGAAFVHKNRDRHHVGHADGTLGTRDGSWAFYVECCNDAASYCEPRDCSEGRVERRHGPAQIRRELERRDHDGSGEGSVLPPVKCPGDQGGATLYEVQRLLRHSSPNVTVICAHLGPNQIHDTENRIRVLSN